MNKTWVLVADSEKARLFEYERGRAPWAETACFVNPDVVHGPTFERPPRVHESVGPARHAIEPRTDGKDKAAARFASTLVGALRAAHGERRFQSLVIAAAPRFLGTLHGELDRTLQQCVSREIRRNLTGLDSEGIRDYLLD
ncbi:MAG TPA: host attachment protein [Frateuria sp.]|uniref:host attachment protein n=1 Tax=Frateuria sp. TaxID=2211372 RepID=UPI002D8057CD|nr:host attachment protein [Frateuria sp.]HET6805520.1 host attachment protein [Frateuria sp.]